MGHALWQWDVVYKITALQIFMLHEMRLKQASVRVHELQHRSDEEMPSSLWAHPYKFFYSTKDAQHFAKQVWVYTPAVLRQSSCMMLWGKQWYRNLLISKWKTKCVLVCLSVFFPSPLCVCFVCVCVCVCVCVWVGWLLLKLYSLRSFQRQEFLYFSKPDATTRVPCFNNWLKFRLSDWCTYRNADVGAYRCTRQMRDVRKKVREHLSSSPIFPES